MILSALGLSLFQISADAISAIPGGVAGNFSQDLVKATVRSLAERMGSGGIPRNHDLQRAVYRACLQATVIAIRSYRHGLLERDGARRKWCDKCLAFLPEETIAATQPGHLVPDLTASCPPDHVLALSERSNQTTPSCMEQLTLESLWRFLADWHAREQKQLGLAAPPIALREFLFRESGFAPTESDGLLQRAVAFFQRRRGGAARMSHRQQERLSDAQPPSRVRWSSLFSGFFAEELKSDARAHDVFTLQLLRDLKCAAPADLQTKLAEQWRSDLQAIAAEFAQQFASLAALIRENDQALLARLDTLSTAGERDTLLLQSIARTVESTHALVQEIHAGTIGCSPRATASPPFAISRYAAAHFVGRARETAALVGLLLGPSPRCVVVGPAGMGKTGLAAHAIFAIAGSAGEQLAASPFPDGVIVLDLYRLKAERDACWHRLADLVAGPTYADRKEAFARAQGALDGKALLIVIEGAELADGKDGRAALDQIAGDAGPLSTTCRVLVLTRLSTQAGAKALHLDEALSRDDARELLTRLVGATVALPAPVLEDVLDLCAGLPLALTWAGGLLAQGCDRPENFAAEWRSARLPGLADPENRQHTLSWLFERSVRTLDEASRTLLSAAASLAHAPVPVSAFAAALGDSAEFSRAPLRELAARQLLRVSPDDTWSFTHVLGYQFARVALPPSDALLSRMGDWCVQRLAAVLRPGPASVSDVLLETDRLLTHAAGLVGLDANSQLKSLRALLLFDVVNRLVALGSLAAVEKALRTVGAYFPNETQPQSTPDYSHLRVAWHVRLGALASAQGKLDLAERHFSAYRDIAQRLADSDPSNAQWQRDLSYVYTLLAQLKETQGIFKSALPLAEASLAIDERLAKLDSTNATWQKDVTVSRELVTRLRSKL